MGSTAVVAPPASPETGTTRDGTGNGTGTVRPDRIGNPG